jgi:hypothetical protein
MFAVVIILCIWNRVIELFSAQVVYFYASLRVLQIFFEQFSTLYFCIPILLSTWLSGALSLGVKRPEREADHRPPSSAEVKNAWSYTSTPPIHFYGVVLS